MVKITELDFLSEPFCPDSNKKVQLMPECDLFHLLHKNLLTTTQRQQILKPEDESNVKSTGLVILHIGRSPQPSEELLHVMSHYLDTPRLPMSVDSKLSLITKSETEALSKLKVKECHSPRQDAFEEENLKEIIKARYFGQFNDGNAKRLKEPAINKMTFDFTSYKVKKLSLPLRAHFDGCVYVAVYNVPRYSAAVDAILESTKNCMYCDTMLYVGMDAFYCHMHVLATYSQHFRKNRLRHQFRLPSPGVSRDILFLIYIWMLDGEITINSIIFVRVFLVARYLCITPLVTEMWKALERIVDAEEFNALFMYFSARRAHDSLLMDAMIGRIHKSFVSMVASIEFLNLEAQELQRFLESDELGVNSEMEVLFAVVRWLSHRWKSRTKHAIHLLECVRFRCMDVHFIGLLKRPTGSRVLDELLNWPTIQATLCDALFAKAAVMGFENCEDSDEKLSNSLSRYTRLPCKRMYAFNRYVAFHHNVTCPLWEPITYELFKKYLHVLQDATFSRSTQLFNATKSLDFYCCCANKPLNTHQVREPLLSDESSMG